MIASGSVRFAIALMSAPAANHLSPPAITMQRTAGSSSQRSHTVASSSISSGDSALRASGRSSRARPTAPRVSAATVAIAYGTSAFSPVTARPMISFWIWEVPSYRVVTRASRR